MHPFWNFVVKVRRMHITLNISKFFATIQLMTDDWHFWHTWSLKIIFFLFVHSFYQHGWHQILLPLQDLCFLCWIFSCWPSLILTSLLLVCPHSFLSAHLHTKKMWNAPCGVIACLYNGTLHGLMCVCTHGQLHIITLHFWSDVYLSLGSFFIFRLRGAPKFWPSANVYSILLMLI